MLIQFGLHLGAKRLRAAGHLCDDGRDDAFILLEQCQQQVCGLDRLMIQVAGNLLGLENCLL